MSRRDVLERRRRHRRIQMIRRSIKVGVYVVVGVAVCFGVWKLAGPLVERAQKDRKVETQAATDVAANPGDAVRTAYDGSNGNTGWNVDDAGWWYLNDDNTYFTGGWQEIDSQNYYFTEDGYMATGWQDIDGESYFFAVDGVEDPDAQQKLVALTYDDGPSSHTERLLDCLEANGVKATFFVVGTQVEEYPDTLKREDELGMEIGSHTYDHTYLTKVDAATITQVMDKNNEVVNGLVGHNMSIMRPTGGGINDTVRATIDVPMICWDVDTLDWKTKDVQSTVDTILAQVQDGSVVLMHDLYEPTVEASEIIIPELIKQGYKLVTVSELAEKRGVTLEAGKDYYDFYPPASTSDTANTDDAADTENTADESDKSDDTTENTNEDE